MTHLSLVFLVSLGIASSQNASLVEGFTSTMMRATFIVDGPHVGNPVDRYYGSGFLLERAVRKQVVLVTAAHVFENIAGDSADVYYRRKIENGNFEVVPQLIYIRRNGIPLYKKAGDADLTALEVRVPLEAERSPVPESLLLGDAMLKAVGFNPGVDVLSLGFPLKNSINPSEAFPIVRRGTVTSFHILPELGVKEFAVSMETFEGESGGPVYIDYGGMKRGIIGLIYEELSDAATKTPLRVAKVLYSDLIKQLIDSM